ncbi:MAG: SMC-Scp complex subunit ScpB, partial [Candidatus Aenigmarchaeota archaeon]|nr:SMC-Scp complex subunit ScpB [Candidatus Aenigmarchaeota archaeon]
MLEEKKALLEAALFVSHKPLTIREIGKILGTRSEKIIRKVMDELRNEFRRQDRGVQLISTPEGYRLIVKSEFLPKVAPLTPYRDLSEGMVRSLAIIAAMQPIKQSELVRMQGNKVYDYVKKLEQKKLIKTKKAGKTKILETTKQFEAYFGKSIEEIRARLREV